MMKYNINDFFKNPHNFDYPPPCFEDNEDEEGWTVLAKAIISDDKRYIRYARQWKEKEKEWSTPHFIKPVIKIQQPIMK